MAGTIVTACDFFLEQSAHWLAGNNLNDWASRLVLDTNNRCRAEPWLQALRALPVASPQPLQLLEDAVACGSFGISSKRALDHLRMLKPWRKGPFVIQGTTIQSEWNCAMKWNRLQSAIAPFLVGSKVLDVGSGNGYYSWRCLLKGAAQVLNVDANPLAWAQWQTCQTLLQDSRCGFMPVTIETLPDVQPPVWNLALCLGVIYHSPAVFALLRQLRSLLVPGGKLVIETLVVDGDENTVFTPQARYASMPNVWAIPSLAALARWLERCGFVDREVITPPLATTSEEQSASEWSNNFSLADSLAPDNQNITIEGYPAPRRAIVMAARP